MGREIAAIAAILGALVGAVPAAPEITAIGSQLWNQDSDGIQGERELGDHFGVALAVGDFNCDGIDDLAIGVPGEATQFDCDGDGDAEPNECYDAGAVNVIYGSPRGLDASLGEPDQILTQATSGVPGDPELHDRFGSVLARMYTGGSCDDLAVGVPGESIGAELNAGAVYYFRGTSSGLVADGWIVQGQDGIPNSPEQDDAFGASLSVGATYIDPACSPPNNRVHRLLIGVPGEEFAGGFADEGAVQVVRVPCQPADPVGSLPSAFNCQAGLGPACSLRRVGAPGVMNAAGAKVAGGEDFDAVGAPRDDTFADAGGSVRVLVEDGSNQICSQNLNGSPDVVEPGDFQGSELAIGDFDGDGREDLLVGAYFESLESVPAEDAGAVNTYYGISSGGYDYPAPGPDSQMFDQGDFTGEVPSFNERFGAGLAAGDFDGDGVDDAAIGALWETVEVPGPDVQGAGSIHLLYGEAGIGLGTSGNDSYDVSDLDIPGEPLHREFFGYELEAGDFDGDGRDDLAVSAPGELHSGITGGGVFVLFGGSGSGYLTRIEFAETPQTWTEGNTAIVLTLERIGNRVYPLSVSYNDAAAGTASAGSDYQSLGGVLTWGAGDSTPRQITVNLLEDFLDEPSETIVLDITPESGVGVDDGDSLTLTILDDDAQPAVQHADGCRIVAESIGTVNLTVTRSGGANGGVTVDYATSNGTASAPSDYTAENGTLTFGFNDNAENIGIAVASDAGDEAPLESFRVTLSNPGGGAVLGTPTVVTVWVRDDDGPTLIFASNFECGDAADWSLDVP